MENKFIYLVFFGKKTPVGGMNDLVAIKEYATDARDVFNSSIETGLYDWGHIARINEDICNYGIIASWERGQL